MRLVGAVLLAAALALVAEAPARAQGHHRVARGETLGEIATRHGLDVWNVAQHNGLSERASLRAGQRIRIPSRDFVWTRARRSLADVAEAHGVDLEALAYANGLSPGARVARGHRLLLPRNESLTPRPERDWGAPAEPGVVDLVGWNQKGRLRLRVGADAVPAASLRALGEMMRRPRPERRALADLVARAMFAARPRRPGPGLGTWVRTQVLQIDPAVERTPPREPPREEAGPHPRLALLVAAISDHFGGRPILVVSGLRRPERHTRSTSRHVAFRATDIRVAGVPHRAVWDYCRSLSSTGCGLYPNSSFVHVDVREQAAQWVDWSGPGEAPRYGGLWGPWRSAEDRDDNPRVGREVTRATAVPATAVVVEELASEPAGDPPRTDATRVARAGG